MEKRVERPQKAHYVDGVDVSYHATLMYLNRFYPELVEKINLEIVNIVKSGRRMKYQDEAIKLMNNGYKPSIYHELNDKVVVMSADNCVKTVLDISGQQRKRWSYV